MLRRFVKDLKSYRRSVARSFGEGFGIHAWEAVPESILSMICEAHFPSVREDKSSEEKVCKGLTDGYDLGYQGDLGGLLWRNFQGTKDD